MLFSNLNLGFVNNYNCVLYHFVYLNRGSAEVQPQNETDDRVF